MTKRAALRWPMAALLGLLVLGMLLTAALPAAAHAVLRSTSPSDGERLEEAPDRVSMEFNEPVEAPLGAVRVFDERGQRVDAGDAGRGSSPEQLTVTLEADLGPGTYVVTWRAISADAHPVRGAFVFLVGAGEDSGDDLLSSLLAQGGDTGFEVAAALNRWLLYAAALLAAGGLAFLLGVHDRDAAEQPTLTRIVVVATVVVIAATGLGVLLQGALATGLGVSSFWNPQVLVEVGASNYGIAAAVRLGGAALLLLASRRLLTAPNRTLGWGAIAVSLGSFTLSGHSVNAEPLWLVLPANFAHTVAAAIWFGGLVLLLVTLRRRKLSDDAVGGAALVGRFSSMATYAVGVVSVAGLGLAWAEIRATRAIFSTTYGWTVVVKVLLVAAVLAVGAYNRQRLVPAVKRAGEAAWRTLRRTVSVEVGALVAVLLVTAVLVNLVPARTEAGITGIFSADVELGDEHLMNLVVDPNRAGRNEIHIYLLTELGRLADIGEEVTIRLTQTEQDIGPITRTPRVAGPGHFILAGPELSVPGPWEIEVAIRVSDFEQLSATVPVYVGG